jgi:HAD superfamily hydrolase (TIGR01509 family)
MKTILVDAWNTFVTEKGMDYDLKKLLDSYPNPKIILTNANKQECITYGIVNMPYEVFSLEHKPNKTDKAYYLKMLSHFKLKPTEVVYFEHNAVAINSASSVGINTFPYNKEENLDGLGVFLKNNLD